MLVDVHTHLFHEKFNGDVPAIITRAEKAGLSHIVVNGLNPKTNRQTLEMSKKYKIIEAAAGIYPLDAVNDILPDDFELNIEKFDVEEEISFISDLAENNSIIAVGECGLDAYWGPESTLKRQEEVFLNLTEIAVKHDLPIIIHTRKQEKRAFEILAHHGVQKVNFHCYGGKVKMALREAEKHGWHFSIPANARKSESFSKLLRDLPKEQILTETDAPYLAPNRGERNEPMHVKGTVEYLAELRGWTFEETAALINSNYNNLFNKKAR